MPVDYVGIYKMVKGGHLWIYVFDGTASMRDYFLDEIVAHLLCAR
jgi:hypothetical protein